MKRINTCPYCNKQISYTEQDYQTATFTNKFDVFALSYLPCPNCNTIMPVEIYNEESGEIMTDFTFNK